MGPRLPRVGGFRAKDADRDRFVELIEAAYVDGQLGAQDRELRVSRALSAETLDELKALTRDLQVPAGAVAPDVVSATPARSRSRRATGVVVGLVLFVVLVVAGVTGVVALAMFAVSGESDSATSTGVASAPAETEISGEQEVAAPTFEMSPSEVRGFLRAYEEQFGTLEVYEAGFYPSRVGVMVPVRGSRPRVERWSWTGEWRQDTEASRVTGPGGIVDLGTVDVRRMFANIDTARRTLDVDRGKLTHVLVNRWFDDQPSVNIYIGNKFNESGYLKTTPSGDVIRAYPYDA